MFNCSDGALCTALRLYCGEVRLDHWLDQVRWDPPNNLEKTYNHILKVSGEYLHSLPRYKGGGNKLSTGERERERVEKSRVESRG